jgi:hypothetical protein
MCSEKRLLDSHLESLVDLIHLFICHICYDIHNISKSPISTREERERKTRPSTESGAGSYQRYRSRVQLGHNREGHQLHIY